MKCTRGRRSTNDGHMREARHHPGRRSRREAKGPPVRRRERCDYAIERIPGGGAAAVVNNRRRSGGSLLKGGDSDSDVETRVKIALFHVWLFRGAHSFVTIRGSSRVDIFRRFRRWYLLFSVYHCLHNLRVIERFLVFVLPKI